MVLDEKQIQTTQLLVQLLPADNATLLQCLLHLLYQVSRQDSSKMTADTLGTLFAPHLIVPKKVGTRTFRCRNQTELIRYVYFALFCVQTLTIFIISSSDDRFRAPVQGDEYHASRVVYDKPSPAVVLHPR